MHVLRLTSCNEAIVSGFQLKPAKSSDQALQLSSSVDHSQVFKLRVVLATTNMHLVLDAHESEKSDLPCIV